MCKLQIYVNFGRIGYQVRLPVALQRVDADLAAVAHVRVKDLRQEEPLGRAVREVLADGQLGTIYEPISAII
jgi:hypothetical protein